MVKRQHSARVRLIILLGIIFSCIACSEKNGERLLLNNKYSSNSNDNFVQKKSNCNPYSGPMEDDSNSQPLEYSFEIEVFVNNTPVNYSYYIDPVGTTGFLINASQQDYIIKITVNHPNSEAMKFNWEARGYPSGQVVYFPNRQILEVGSDHIGEVEIKLFARTSCGFDEFWGYFKIPGGVR